MAKGRVQPEQVVGRLGHDEMAVLTSTDRGGQPHLSTVSWYRGRLPDAVDLIVGRTARFLKNIEARPAATMLVFLETAYALAGTADIIVRDIPDMPIPLTLVRLKIESVYEALFTGAELLGGPRYRKEYPEKLKDLDQIVDAYFDVVPESVPTRPLH